MTTTLSTKSVGDISEVAITLALMKAGKTVLKPMGDDKRYDLVIEEDGKFLRVQCKTGRVTDGKIMYHAHNHTIRKGGRRQYKDYKGQIEYFGVYSPELDKVYLVPIEDACAGVVSLRIAPTKNSQKKRIKFAKDYEL